MIVWGVFTAGQPGRAYQLLCFPIKFRLCVVGLLVLASCAGPKKETSPSRPDAESSTVAVSSDTINKQSTRLSTDRSKAQATRWRYEKTTDRTGNPVYKASLLSSNVLQFPYPYTGGSTATLGIRKGNESTYVSIEVSNGQFNRSFQAGSALVRFDGQAPITYSLSAAANGRANIVFFDKASALIKRLKTAKDVTMQVKFPGQTTQTIKFRSAGLQWHH
ncbi:MAG: hypothetical protein JWP57_979 [Spirosoma sp.]|nr:hypothetical protein [Spirosoma sp.]